VNIRRARPVVSTLFKPRVGALSTQQHGPKRSSTMHSHIVTAVQ